MTPQISVVVPAHERPGRLRTLLDALAGQTLERDRWELVVVFDDAGEEAATLLREHPLAPRTQRLPPGTGSPSRQRNVGWRLARAPLVAFTDDDCRPDPGWLEALLSAARPGAIVQGTTRPDPLDEADVAQQPWTRTLDVTPPSKECPTCNVAYPRALLEELRGFDEAFPGAAGEDTDLVERARGTGAPHLAAPDALVFHAVQAYTLRGMLRLSWKWQALPAVVKRHPHLRPRGGIWKPSHAELLLAAAGLAATRRQPLAAALVLPYVKRYRLRALPGCALIDGTEIAALARGSLRHRTFLL